MGESGRGLHHSGVASARYRAGVCLESATMTPWQRDVTARALYKRRRVEEADAAAQWQLEAT